MLVTSASFHLICRHCQREDDAYKFDIGYEISEVATFSRIISRLCPNCFNKMEIVCIKCDIEHGLYGNPDYGEWTCPVHNHQFFEAYLLKRAAIDPTTNIPRARLYNAVINSGFPWVCPICKSPLQYSESLYT